MENKYKNAYNITKIKKREDKRINKRNITGEEVIFIFEKILEGWKPIKIYNVIIQTNPNTLLDKKQTEVISTGNCKVYETELSEERYDYYCLLRTKIYELNKDIKIL
jgi:hypothetical protein